MTIPTRERILRAAEDLYVLRGHDGFSFGDVAAAVGTTRANIHHHFGNKRRLMAELLDRFAGDAEDRIRANWAAPGWSFARRMQAQCEDLFAFYRRFNPEGGTPNVWSPVARVRLDLPALGDLAGPVLRRVNHAYDQALQDALRDAIAAGELRPDTAVGDIVRMLRITFLSCGPATQDSGSFEEVERLLRGMSKLVRTAWGTGAAPNAVDKAARRSGY